MEGKERARDAGCHEMCPFKEVLERSQNLQPLEVFPQGHKCPHARPRTHFNGEVLQGDELVAPVKEYRRLEHEEYRRLEHEEYRRLEHEVLAKQGLTDVRSGDALRVSVQHLLTCVLARDDISFPRRYRFISDRLRSVRKDIRTQDLFQKDTALTLSLFEAMVHFKVLALDRLRGVPLEVFDPKLNSDLLKDCFEGLFMAYEVLAKAKLPSKNRSYFILLLLLVNLNLEPPNNSNPLASEGGSVFTLVRELSPTQLSTYLRAYRVLSSRNYVDFFRLLEELRDSSSHPSGFFLACALSVHSVPMQLFALRAMNVSFRPKGWFPLQDLAGLLHIGSTASTEKLCILCGLPTRRAAKDLAADSAVQFHAVSFQHCEGASPEEDLRTYQADEPCLSVSRHVQQARLSSLLLAELFPVASEEHSETDEATGAGHNDGLGLGEAGTAGGHATVSRSGQSDILAVFRVEDKGCARLCWRGCPTSLTLVFYEQRRGFSAVPSELKHSMCTLNLQQAAFSAASLPKEKWQSLLSSAGKAGLRSPDRSRSGRLGDCLWTK
eukprot:g561.t1